MSLSIARSNYRRFLAGLLVLLVLGGMTAAVWADPTAPSANDRQVTRTIALLVAKDHLSRHPLDNEISQRTLTLFLKMLDPMKRYFYQSDVDTWVQRQNELVEKARRGDISPAYEIFRTFLQRVEERVKTVDEVLAVPPDFTLQEELLVDRDSIQHPRTPAEAYESWRKWIKYELLKLKAEKTEGQAAQQKLSKRYHNFAKRMHQTDGDELLEMYLNSMTSSFDPHTNYMSPATVENFDIVMKLELEGIGAALQFDDGYTVVNKLIPGGAAEKDGRLKVKDKIVGVGQGRNGEIVDVVDMKLPDVVKLIRGKRGTMVRLQVASADDSEPRIVDITRERIELKDSEARSKIFEEGRRADGQPYKLGVIDLPSFYMDMTGARQMLPDYKSTTRDVHRILDDFNRKGVDAVVLDLRRNGGGSLTEAIALTGLFIDEGPVVQVKGTDGKVQPYNDPDPGMAWPGPLVVLTSKFSASASEILAGAVQDYRRGLIVGDHTTHGKGTVQSLQDLGQRLFWGPNTPSLGALKITMQQFYRPNGDSTQNRGVLADIELPSVTTYLDIGEKDLDYSVSFDREGPLQFKHFNYVDQTLCDQLRFWSQERCAKLEDFQKVLRHIARYKEQKERKRVTLNEKQFMEDRAELNADDEEEKKVDEMNDPQRSTIERDYYLNEALAIAADYVGLLTRGGQVKLAGPREIAPAHE